MLQQDSSNYTVMICVSFSKEVFDLGNRKFGPEFLTVRVYVLKKYWSYHIKTIIHRRAPSMSLYDKHDFILNEYNG